MAVLAAWIDVATIALVCLTLDVPRRLPATLPSALLFPPAAHRKSRPLVLILLALILVLTLRDGMIALVPRPLFLPVLSPDPPTEALMLGRRLLIKTLSLARHDPLPVVRLLYGRHPRVREIAVGMVVVSLLER